MGTEDDKVTGCIDGNRGAHQWPLRIIERFTQLMREFVIEPFCVRAGFGPGGLIRERNRDRQLVTVVEHWPVGFGLRDTHAQHRMTTLQRIECVSPRALICSTRNLRRHHYLSADTPVKQPEYVLKGTQISQHMQFPKELTCIV